MKEELQKMISKGYVLPYLSANNVHEVIKKDVSTISVSKVLYPDGDNPVKSRIEGGLNSPNVSMVIKIIDINNAMYFSRVDVTEDLEQAYEQVLDCPVLELVPLRASKPYLAKIIEAKLNGLLKEIP